ncbi:ParA family protein [Agromyces humi]|uniref:ParA family protein n=1 Tax=Agromyces humi TaxID=1766800 RepID=UPI001357C8F6|nr:AAA family ATPase [Agromyces humi]
MAIVLTISNNKGGVGKSQFTVQTAAGLARRGSRVLVIDMDPQANATRRLGVEWDPAAPILTMSEVIKADAEGAGEQAVIACGWVDEDGTPTSEAELIDVLPARFDLINRESESGVLGAVRRLKKALDGWVDDYDFVLIDTRPDLGHLVQMAMAAAHYVIIPTEPGYDGVEAAIRVSDFVSQHAVDLANPTLQIGGVVVTRRKATAEKDFQLAGLADRFGELVWNLAGPTEVRGVEIITPKHIPEWSRFDEADAAAVSLSAWNDKRGRETVAIYDQVARRITERVAG